VSISRTGRPRRSTTAWILPAPNPDSRVTLGDEVDPLGLRRVRLDWRLSEIDERTFRWMADRLGDHLKTKGLT
jgi:hypothetical protein